MQTMTPDGHATSELAPIALFVYNRLDHVRQTVEALQRNFLATDSDLVVYSDAPKNDAAVAGVEAVRAYARTITGFRSVTLRKRALNVGVDAAVIEAVTELCESHGRVIAVEDDIVTARWFLTYMNRALDLYADDERVMQVAGAMYPLDGFASGRASFIPTTSSWGWATWKRAWTMFDSTCAGYAALHDDYRLRRRFNENGAYDHFTLLYRYVHGKETAWDIQWYLSVFARGGLVLHPDNSLVRNIGLDGTGEHCDATTPAGDRIDDHEIVHFPSSVAVNRRLVRHRQRYLRAVQKHTIWWTLRYVWMRGAKKRLLGEPLWT